MKYVCAITGHRPSHFTFGYDETDPKFAEFRLALFEELYRLVEQGYHTFLSGMAQGTDLWAAEIVLLLRDQNRPNRNIQLICALPCREQARYWPTEQRERYENVLNKADKVVFVSEKYNNRCMAKRNRYLVDHGSMVLAVYDGSTVGGTAQTVRYAQKKGMEIRTLHPKHYPCTALILAHRVSPIML